MNIAQSSMVSQILFGEGASMAIGQTLQQMGVQKALIITDQIIRKVGLIDGVVSGMEQAGIDFDVFDGVQPENPAEIIDTTAVMITENGYKALVAVGGGSAMDLAKSVRILMAIPELLKITSIR